MPEGIKNIHQRIIEARKLIPEVKKDKRGDYFPYASASAIYRPAREAMDRAGISYLVFLNETSFSPHQTKDGGEQYFVKIQTLHQLVNADDPNDFVKIAWEGHAIDSGEKGIGKAFTYANKTFLASQFLIPVDLDDPDAHQGGGRAAQGGRPDFDSVATPLREVVKVKSGKTSKGKPYTLYHIVTSEGKKFETFDENHVAMAQSAIKTVQMVEIKYRTDKYGDHVESISILQDEGAQ